MDLDPTSAKDAANQSSDLPDLDTDEEEVLEEDGVTGEEDEEEEQEEEGNEVEGIESKRERMKKLNCLSIQREGKLWTYI